VARAKDTTRIEPSLYERDFNLWVGEQARLLKEGRFDQLDRVNLIDEIEDLGRREKRAVRNNLVVIFKNLLKHKFHPGRRSRSWLASMVEHRRRLREDLATSPSLRPYARERFEQSYQDGRKLALIETGLGTDAMPVAAPWSLEQTLDPDFLPD
jgi:Domain of unknown function DUF29